MRIDLTDLERIDGIAEALARLFWCLVVVAFLAAVLGSAGTGLLVLVLGAAAFVVRVGLEDLARTRRRREERAEARPKVTIRRARRSGSAPVKAQRPRSAADRRRGSAPTGLPS